MKTKKSDYYSEAILILQELNKTFPRYNMGRHLSTALDGYGDIWGLTDKELVFALTKYKTQLELDEPHLADEEEIKQIQEDAMYLNSSDLQPDDDFINGQDY